MGDQIGNIRIPTSSISLGSLEQESTELAEDPFFIYLHVFAQPKIFELILDYAIDDQDSDLELKTIQNLRLVEKRWLITITNIMRKNNECLFFLKLTKENSLNSSSMVQDNGKILDQFVTCMEKRMEEHLPTFQLTVEDEFLREENYDSLISCFQKCGEGLLAMYLNLPASGMSFAGIFSNEPLSALETLGITFSNLELQALTNTEVITDTNVSLMLSSLLTRNSTILDLSFSWHDHDSLPVSFEYLNLPLTLTELELKSFQTPQMLKLLARNNLPNLENLKLFISNDCELHDKQIFEVLNKIKGTLKTLTIDGEIYDGPPKSENQTQFSVMEKLETLRLDTIDLELTDTSQMTLATCLPKLRNVTLHQTIPMLEAWTSSPLSNVTRLNMSLANEDVEDNQPGHWCPVTLETMQKINIAFPNVSDLVLGLNVAQGDTCGLKYMFMEIKHLTKLSLYFYGTGDILGSDFLDSVFIGAPVEMVAALRQNPEYWKNLELKDEIPSIRMLGALESLFLCSDDDDTSISLISDLTLEFGLLKMPMMEELFMENRFFISEKMAKE